MDSLDQLKYNYWIASRSVAAMRADLVAAEKELEAARVAYVAAYARARCGPVVVA